MASFAYALDFLIPHEGGTSNNPNDSGGRTKYGVTQASLTAFMTAHPACGFSDDVYALTLTQAATFYATAGYWKFSTLKSDQVGAKLLDMSVNMGSHQAVKLAQQILGVTVDGQYGPATEAAINAQDPSAFVAALCQSSADYYQSLVVSRPLNAVFLRGWLKRAADVPK